MGGVVHIKSKSTLQYTAFVDDNNVPAILTSSDLELTDRDSDFSKVLRWFYLAWRSIVGARGGYSVTSEKGSLTDVITTDKEVRVILELPSVNSEDIKVDVHNGIAEISAHTAHGKYRRQVRLPPDVSLQPLKTTIKNGILEIICRKAKAGSETEQIAGE